MCIFPLSALAMPYLFTIRRILRRPLSMPSALDFRRFSDGVNLRYHTTECPVLCIFQTHVVSLPRIPFSCLSKPRGVYDWRYTLGMPPAPPLLSGTYPLYNASWCGRIRPKCSPCGRTSYTSPHPSLCTSQIIAWYCAGAMPALIASSV